MLPNNFTPFFGVVEGLNDPEPLGRVQVRVYGYHPENKAMIPTDMLRWFSSVVSNSAGVSGKGHSPTGYVKGSTVFGYFIDEFYQDGIVIGSLTGKPTSFATTNLGFNDPEGLYPQYINESDVNRLARGDRQHFMFEFRERSRYQNIQLPFRKGSYSELPYNNKSQYPKNDVHESESGHVKEIDDTPGNERIHEYHRAGSYYEIDKDGNHTIKVVGDGYEIVAGNKYANIRGTLNLTVEGNVNQYIKGDWNLQVDGNKTEVIQGSTSEYYAGGQNTFSNGGIAIDGSTINLNSGMASGAGSSPITLAEEYDVEFVRPILIIAGRYAALDSPGEIESTPSEYPEDLPPESFDGEIKEESPLVDEEKITEDIAMCSTKIDEGSIDYSKKLGSTDFTIADFTINAYFPHSIVSQVGLSEQEIVCNLESLAENIIQPLKDEYGDFRINSGFRVGSGRSQHNKGMACDIQTEQWNPSKYLEVAEWIAQNLPVDQIILEHGNAQWIHISFDPTKTTQRGSLLTMLGGKFEQGLRSYY